MFFKRNQQDFDYMLFGLGNPGPRYAGTRHNVGWWLLDLLLERYPSERHYSRHRSVVDICRIGEHRVACIKPTTFMNLSGESLRSWLREQTDTPYAVIYDDTALPVGKIRIREKGSAGGHNGVKSIISCLDSDEFLRLRIGVGNPQDEDSADYVLAPPSEIELKQIHESLILAVKCCEELVEGSVGRAQILASGQQLPEKRKKKAPRPVKPTRLSMADIIAGKLKPTSGAGSEDHFEEDEADASN